MRTISELIQVHLDARGMTAAELARKSGVSKGHMSHLINGHRTDPGVGVIAALAAAMDIPPGALIPPGLTALQIKAVRATQGDDLTVAAARLSALLAEVLSRS